MTILRHFVQRTLHADAGLRPLVDSFFLEPSVGLGDAPFDNGEATADDRRPAVQATSTATPHSFDAPDLQTPPLSASPSRGVHTAQSLRFDGAAQPRAREARADQQSASMSPAGDAKHPVERLDHEELFDEKLTDPGTVASRTMERSLAPRRRARAMTGAPAMELSSTVGLPSARTTLRGSRAALGGGTGRLARQEDERGDADPAGEVHGDARSPGAVTSVTLHPSLATVGASPTARMVPSLFTSPSRPSTNVHAAAPSSQTVEVSIGRIEIRAQPPTSWRPEKPAARPSGPSLSGYLSQRREAKR